MSTHLHHVTEEVDDPTACWKCGHSAEHHGTYSQTSTECYAQRAIFVQQDRLSALPCLCRRYSRGYLRAAAIAACVIVGVWMALNVVSWVAGR